MKRAAHNARWGVARLPSDVVHCHTIGYGEHSQYDSRCCFCYLGHRHTWAQHDASLERADARAAAETSPPNPNQGNE